MHLYRGHSEFIQFRKKYVLDFKEIERYLFFNSTSTLAKTNTGVQIQPVIPIFEKSFSMD